MFPPSKERKSVRLAAFPWNILSLVILLGVSPADLASIGRCHVDFHATGSTYNYSFEVSVKNDTAGPLATIAWAIFGKTATGDERVVFVGDENGVAPHGTAPYSPESMTQEIMGAHPDRNASRGFTCAVYYTQQTLGLGAPRWYNAAVVERMRTDGYTTYMPGAP